MSDRRPRPDRPAARRLLNDAELWDLEVLHALNDAAREKEARERPKRFAKNLRKGVETLMSKALASGGRQTGATTVEWDISGRCQRPARVEYSPKGTARRVLLTVKCRRCRMCRREKANEWASRAVVELRDCRERGARTWFGSLTASADEHYLALCRAIDRATKGGVDWKELREDEKFTRICRVHGEEITRWLKRVRKNSGRRFRYIVVTEQHKSGQPHWHCFLHELTPEATLRKALIQEAWHLGFSNFKLVDMEVAPEIAARYVTKYITKSSLGRVRPSERYGSAHSCLGSNSNRGQGTTVKQQQPPTPHPQSTLLKEV